MPGRSMIGTPGVDFVFSGGWMEGGPGCSLLTPLEAKRNDPPQCITKCSKYPRKVVDRVTGRVEAIKPTIERRVKRE